MIQLGCKIRNLLVKEYLKTRSLKTNLIDMKNLATLFCFLCCTCFLEAQHSHSSKLAFTYPNIEGYVSLKTDLHIHTVFSDGNVWPTIRVQEALRENLDAISLTEHLEYQPHIDDIPHPDRNRSYDLALAEAEEHDLLIVHGSEITRSAPMGHSNAVFITDANPLLTDKAEKAFSSLGFHHPVTVK